MQFFSSPSSCRVTMLFLFVLHSVPDAPGSAERPVAPQKRKVSSPTHSSNGHSPSDTSPSPLKKKKKPGAVNSGSKDQVRALVTICWVFSGCGGLVRQADWSWGGGSKTSHNLKQVWTCWWVQTAATGTRSIRFKHGINHTTLIINENRRSQTNLSA